MDVTFSHLAQGTGSPPGFWGVTATPPTILRNVLNFRVHCAVGFSTFAWGENFDVSFASVAGLTPRVRVRPSSQDQQSQRPTFIPAGRIRTPLCAT
jgi:hypothetical protein